MVTRIRTETEVITLSLDDIVAHLASCYNVVGHDITLSITEDFVNALVDNDYLDGHGNHIIDQDYEGDVFTVVATLAADKTPQLHPILRNMIEGA